MTTAERYVTAAYLVLLGIVLLYVVVYSGKIARLERQVAALTRDPRARESSLEPERREPALALEEPA